LAVAAAGETRVGRVQRCAINRCSLTTSSQVPLRAVDAAGRRSGCRHIRECADLSDNEHPQRV